MKADEIREVVKEAVKETLTTMGLTVDDPIEMQNDFQHLRQWRKGCENTRGMLLKIFLTVTVPSVIYFTCQALWAAIKGAAR